MEIQKKDTLSKLWNDNNPHSKLNKIKNLKKKNLKECFQEEYCKYCTYCPGITFLENKFLERYEPFCKEAKIKMALSKQKHEEIEK